MSKIFEILIIEDNPADARIAKEAFKESNIKYNINVVSDGIQAIDYLRKTEEFRNAVTPDLILLDLNLPKKDGREVLAEVKSDVNLKTIPIIVLTTSQSEQDITNSYSLHANSYISKPVDLESFLVIIKAIEEYWFKLAKLPTRE